MNPTITIQPLDIWGDPTDSLFTENWNHFVSRYSYLSSQIWENASLVMRMGGGYRINTYDGAFMVSLKPLGVRSRVGYLVELN